MKDCRTRLSLVLSLVLLFMSAGCDGGKRVEATTNAVKAVKPQYAAELAKLSAGIEHGIGLAAKQPSDTLIPLEVVSLYADRARLTGNYDDYAKAEGVLATLPVGAKPSASYCLARVRLHYTLHRLKQAGAALDTCPDTAEPMEKAALRADLSLYSGRYGEAEATYRALVNQSGLAQHYVRLALLKEWLGAPGEAAAFLEAAEKRYHGGSPTMLAWLKLQRGLVALHRGRFDEALAMYRLASDAMDGWWLIDEHIAEVLFLTGKTQEAKLLYEDIIARTANPEFMDALAALEHQQGNHEIVQKWRIKARKIYDQRLATFPEASAGHALSHFLQDEADAARALELAQKNFSTRPYGESAIALAKAWMLAGKPDRSVASIEAQLGRGWDTAEAFWILAEARQSLGQQSRAEQAKAEARRRNPESERMYSSPINSAKVK